MSFLLCGGLLGGGLGLGLGGGLGGGGEDGGCLGLGGLLGGGGLGHGGLGSGGGVGDGGGGGCHLLLCHLHVVRLQARAPLGGLVGLRQERGLDFQAKGLGLVLQPPLRFHNHRSAAVGLEPRLPRVNRLKRLLRQAFEHAVPKKQHRSRIRDGIHKSSRADSAMLEGPL
ncbi:hypothetical protein M885DRAFT_128668 [Pelagophyceae sp. CCMP2097]|nr:hypothetical protein M885DRAFT_128668 [Pelagophyceae sp. CCMP2097]